jgi:hypothetical protein
MTAQTVTIQVDQVTAQILETLKVQAEAQGSNLATMLLSLMAFMGNGSEKPKEEMTPKERAQAFEEWVNAHSISVSHFVDDSRESIYTREDEAL